MKVILLFAAGLLLKADPREIVRKCIELDQTNWVRMKDYTWTARETTRHLDSEGHLKSVDSEAWETIILNGRPVRKMIERHGKPLSADDLRKEQEKVDRAMAKHEDYEKQRLKDRAFLLEIPDAFEFRLEGEEKNAWVIHASPKVGYQPKHGDAQAFKKIEGTLWIDKSEFQWIRIEAKTIDTISWAWCVARLNAGATLLFEQARVNDEVWLPKREVVKGSGRIAVVKKLAEEQETTWNNYRKFHVDSKVVSTQ